MKKNNNIIHIIHVQWKKNENEMRKSRKKMYKGKKQMMMRKKKKE